MACHTEPVQIHASLRPLLGRLLLMWFAAFFFLTATSAKTNSATLFDDAAVSFSRFKIAESGFSESTILVTIGGVRIGPVPGELRTIDFEIVPPTTGHQTVALAFTEAGTGISVDNKYLPTVPGGGIRRMLLTTNDAKSGELSPKILSLDSKSKSIVAPVCTTLADPANVEAITLKHPDHQWSVPNDTLRSLIVSLATECQNIFKKAGVFSDGFVSRARLSKRLRESADGLVTSRIMEIDNWVGTTSVGNSAPNGLSGAIVVFRGVEISGSKIPDEGVKFGARSILWDGKLSNGSMRRIALYGRVSQYPGAPSGLLDGADQIAIDLTPGKSYPYSLVETVSQSSFAGLLLLEHALSNLRVMRAASIEGNAAEALLIKRRFSDNSAAYWSAAATSDDVSDALEVVWKNIFQRSFQSEEQVRDLQSKLKNWGLYLEEIDGKVGAATITAFKLFEVMISGASNGALSAMERVALSTTPDSSALISAVRVGSLGDYFMLDNLVENASGHNFNLLNLENHVAALQDEIFGLEAKVNDAEAKKEDAKLALSSIRFDCRCEGGRLCD